HQQICPRAEFDHAEANAFFDVVARLQPADDAAGDSAGNLLDTQRSAGDGVGHVDPELLIALGARGLGGVEIFAGEIANLRDHSRAGHAVDVDIKDRQENADPHSGAEIGFVNRFNVRDHAVGWANDGVGVRWNGTLGVAKEIDDLEPKKKKRYGQGSEEWM